MDRATVGDRMVVAGATLGAPVRDGEILEVRGQHGGPPYLVQWSDTGRESLFFPGPDSHVDHLGEDESAKQEVEFSSGVEPAHPAIAGESSAAHVNHWQVDLYLFEDADQTTAQAVLRTPAVSRLDARGLPGAARPTRTCRRSVMRLRRLAPSAGWPTGSSVSHPTTSRPLRVIRCTSGASGWHERRRESQPAHALPKRDQG